MSKKQVKMHNKILAYRSQKLQQNQNTKQDYQLINWKNSQK